MRKLKTYCKFFIKRSAGISSFITVFAKSKKPNNCDFRIIRNRDLFLQSSVPITAPYNKNKIRFLIIILKSKLFGFLLQENNVLKDDVPAECFIKNPKF